MEMIVLFLALIAVAVAAPRYGADTRTTLGSRRSTPAADLAALWRRIGGPATPGRAGDG